MVGWIYFFIALAFFLKSFFDIYDYDNTDINLMASFLIGLFWPTVLILKCWYWIELKGIESTKKEELNDK